MFKLVKDTLEEYWSNYNTSNKLRTGEARTDILQALFSNSEIKSQDIFHVLCYLNRRDNKDLTINYVNFTPSRQLIGINYYGMNYCIGVIKYRKFEDKRSRVLSTFVVCAAKKNQEPTDNLFYKMYKTELTSTTTASIIRFLDRNVRDPLTELYVSTARLNVWMVPELLKKITNKDYSQVTPKSPDNVKYLNGYYIATETAGYMFWRDNRLKKNCIFKLPSRWEYQYVGDPIERVRAVDVPGLIKAYYQLINNELPEELSR